MEESQDTIPVKVIDCASSEDSPWYCNQNEEDYLGERLISKWRMTVYKILKRYI